MHYFCAQVVAVNFLVVGGGLVLAALVHALALMVHVLCLVASWAWHAAKVSGVTCVAIAAGVRWGVWKLLELMSAVGMLSVRKIGHVQLATPVCWRRPHG